MPPGHIQAGSLGPRPTAAAPSLKPRYLIAVLGAAGVGKTALIRRFLDDSFSPGYRATVEELHRREFTTADARPMVLEILDTAGAYPFPAMRALSIARADAFVLVFAVDDAGSFEEVRSLRDQILGARGARGAPVVVVGNKCDAAGRRVTRATAEATACVDWEHGYVEASARDAVNVDAAFGALLARSSVPALLGAHVARRRLSLPQPAGKRHLLKRNSSCTIA